MPVLSPRALEDMFWSGRYAERAEDLLRLVITATPTRSTSTAPRPDAGRRRAAGAHRRPAAPVPGRAWPDPDLEFRSLLLDADRPGSAAHSLARLRDALEGVRDQLSGDTWRGFGTIDRAMKALRASPRGHQIAESAGRMLAGILSLQGVTASMMRDPGWHMIEAGRYLERALQVCTCWRATTTVRSGIDVDREVLDGVLIAAESSVTHRRRYRGYVRPRRRARAAAASTRDNPRSLAFCARASSGPPGRAAGSTGSTRPERLLEHLEDSARGHRHRRARRHRRTAAAPRLEAFLAATHAQLHRLGDADRRTCTSRAARCRSRSRRCR